MSRDPFLNQVRIRNYKSLGKCEVELGRLSVLVGRNGSGKSNFLDALRFVAESLQTSLDHAIRSRGGIEGVRRRSYGHPHNFGIAVRMNLPNWRTGVYDFEIGAQTKGGFSVKREQLTIAKASGEREDWFRIEDGQLQSSSVQHLPSGVSDRLYLVNASGVPQFRPAYDTLLAMGFYNLNPEQMKAVQNPDAGELLRRDGSNIASVVARLSDDRPDVKERIRDYLGAIVPDIVGFDRVAIGHHETLEFRQEVKGSHHPWRFFAASMSDGTLRTLGILVAVMQLADRKTSVQLVGIEEPETALHPAAAAALMDSLREAATHTQVLVTTHSPDLLDQFDPESDQLLVVQGNQGTTEIAPADPASLDAIRTHLYTAGDLLRMDQLQPDAAELQRQMNLPFELSGVAS